VFCLSLHALRSAGPLLLQLLSGLQLPLPYVLPSGDYAIQQATSISKEKLITLPPEDAQNQAFLTSQSL
jgi:hypothetical protein